ncbi:lysine--tRNA ligase [Martiniozyma asiatica (nom. inval.)]|nr:lysine--tRNA ligase [Martiniozyma asiatica]
MKRFVSTLAEESDFAFRKAAIQKLPIKIQDSLYYPSLTTLRYQLQNQNYTHLRVPAFRSTYEYLTPSIKAPEQLTLLSGCITSIRKAGKGSIFIDIVQDYTKVQLIVHHKLVNLAKDDFTNHHSNFRPGDYIVAVGLPGVTKVGELSLKLNRPLILTSPSLHPLPPKLTDQSKINSNKIVDYLVNKESRETILIRSKIISSIRNYFERNEFIEVETPIISSGNTGATATPFLTSSTHFKNEDGSPRQLSLRVAPELWLKKYIISGFDKVFEIGKCFRNEGYDQTHNPEFTSCEFYKTHTTLSDLQDITEDLLKYIVKELKYKKIALAMPMCEWLDAELGKGIGKIDFIPTLERETGMPLPELTTNNLIEYFNKLNLEIPKGEINVVTLLDELSGKFLEPLCHRPTFIYNIPEALSPLAKSTTIGKHQISLRFELYIKGLEYANAYEEENNPFHQRMKFQMQAGDEAIKDEKFVEFMEWGMAPTGGWGLGIDRLVMLFTGRGIGGVLGFGGLPSVLKH